MQLDAEDDEHAYYRPPIEPAASASAAPAGPRLSGETQVEAASAATADDED